jgi:hypothetical protein
MVAASSCQAPLIVQINDAKDFEANRWAGKIDQIPKTALLEQAEQPSE